MFADDAVDAVNTAFAEFGEQPPFAYAYTPPGGGAATPCTVVRKAPDRPAPFGDSRPMAEGTLLYVRASEIASPARGGTFFDGVATTYTVLGDPETLDDFRLVWTCRVS